MKLLILLLLICSLTYPARAQPDSLQQQINTQVWKPFIESYNSLNTEGFMAVHSKEMTRVIQDDQRLFGYQHYYENNKKGNDHSRQLNHKRNIDLRFTQRIAGDGKAFEVGYYKVTAFTPDGKSRTFYGKFHVLLRKEKGVWKIFMDADAQENTDETVFQSGKPL